VEFLEDEAVKYRFDMERKRPLIPRLRDATWSFQVAMQRSMNGITLTWAISRTMVWMPVASESGKQVVGCSSS